MVGLMATSVRTHAKIRLPGVLPPVRLSPWQATSGPCLCWRSSDTHRLIWPSPLLCHCSFPRVLVHTRFCLCPPRVESLFPPFLWKSCNQIPLVFKVRFPEDSQSVCQISQAGKPDKRHRTFTTVGELPWYYCS